MAKIWFFEKDIADRLPWKPAVRPSTVPQKPGFVQPPPHEK